MAHQTLAATLRAEADLLLDAGLRNCLQAYGRLTVTGSYNLNLMAWPDLDLYVGNETFDLDRHFEMGRALAHLEGVTQMSFRNEVAKKTPNLPPGYYWGLSIQRPELSKGYRDGWKVDIWYVNPCEIEERRTQQEQLIPLLSEAVRDSILEIKKSYVAEHKRVPAGMSWKIYQAVIYDSITNRHEMEWWLAHQEVSSD